MIQVVNRALDILEFVARHSDDAVSLKEIADHAKLNQATAANIIKTLTNRKYLEHIGPKKGFRLGPMAEFLIGNFSLRHQLVLAAKDVMDKLTNDVNENSILGVINNDKRILICTSSIDHDLNVRSKPERNLYETATGRMLLAFLSDKEIESFIEKYGLPVPPTWPEVQSKDVLLKELQRIRTSQIVITKSPKHIVGLAVPVKKLEQVVASLSIYLPESRFTPHAEKLILSKLTEAASEINKRLIE